MNKKISPKTVSKHEDAYFRSFDATIQFALAALKAPAIMGASGVAAMLAFVSANDEKIKSISLPISNILFYFGVTVLICTIATGLSYIAQCLFTYSIVYKKLLIWGVVSQFGAILLIIFSYIFIALAVWELSNIPLAMRN